MQPLILSQAQQRRLERLARLAGRPPSAMIRFVLRDGFAYTEEAVKRAEAGIADATQGRTIPHSRVSREMRAMIAGYGRKRQKAA